MALLRSSRTLIDVDDSLRELRLRVEVQFSLWIIGLLALLMAAPVEKMADYTTELIAARNKPEQLQHARNQFPGSDRA